MAVTVTHAQKCNTQGHCRVDLVKNGWRRMIQPTPERGLSIRQQLKQVSIMAIILFIYSSILALGVWQDEQNQKQNRDQNQSC